MWTIFFLVIIFSLLLQVCPEAVGLVCVRQREAHTQDDMGKKCTHPHTERGESDGTRQSAKGDLQRANIMNNG